MVEIVLSLSLLILLNAGMMVFAGAKSVMALSRIGRFERVDEPEPPDIAPWAATHDFHYIAAFRLSLSPVSTVIHGWRHAHSATFLVKYHARANSSSRVQEQGCDLATYFAPDVSIHSTNMKSGNYYPSRPHSYTQSFPRMSLDNLWNIHQEMCDYLTHDGGARPTTEDRPLDHIMIESVRQHMAYIRNLPLWQLRQLYWHFLRRRFWHNLTIRQQRDKGKINLPNEYNPQQALRV